MKFKKSISIILAIAIIALVGCNPLVSFAEEDFSYKLDKALTEKISNLSDDEKIPVSIWVEDIDHNEVKAQALNQIKNKVSTDTFAIAKAVDNGSELMRLLIQKK